MENRNIGQLGLFPDRQSCLMAAIGFRDLCKCANPWRVLVRAQLQTPFQVLIAGSGRVKKLTQSKSKADKGQKVINPQITENP